MAKLEVYDRYKDTFYTIENESFLWLGKCIN